MWSQMTGQINSQWERLLSCLLKLVGMGWQTSTLRRIHNWWDVLTTPIPIPIQPPRRLCCIYTIIKHFKPGVDLIRQGKCYDSSGETIECARSLSQLTHGWNPPRLRLGGFHPWVNYYLVEPWESQQNVFTKVTLEVKSSEQFYTRPSFSWA